jgi:hypothetical protein
MAEMARFAILAERTQKAEMFQGQSAHPVNQGGN